MDDMRMHAVLQIVINPETQRSKGFGFVKFEDPRDADDAIREADGKVRLSFHAQAVCSDTSGLPLRAA